MMEPLGLFSGEGAWGGNLLSFPTVQSLFAYSLSSRYRSLVTLLSILALLLIFYLLSSQLRFVRNMANGPITNGRADDASKDFKGNLKVNDKPPTKDLLEKVADLPVLDMNKKSHTFKSLYADNENGPRRVLIVFIRHFFCGVRAPVFLHPSIIALGWPDMHVLMTKYRTVKNIYMFSLPQSPLPLLPVSLHPHRSSLSAAAQQT